MKKRFDKALKNIPGIAGNLYTYLFPILLQNKQKPITKSCRNNLRSKPILILSKQNLKFLGKNLVMKRFGFHTNSLGADGIKDIQWISIDFQIQKHGIVTRV